MATEDVSTDEELASHFADDDLGKLQGILFGDHARKTKDRIDTLESALLGAVADLRTVVESRFEALESRLDGEASTRTQAVANVSDRLAEEARIRERAEAALRKDVDSTHEKSTRALDDLEQRASKGLETARSELSAEVETGLQSLGDTRVARNDLAQALIRAAHEIAGTTET